MAATTISGYSDELTATLPPLYAPLKTNRYEGRVRTCNFKYSFTAIAAATSIALAVLPKGARIIGGEIAANATLGSVTIALGLAGKDLTGNIDDAVASGPGFKPDSSAVTVGTAVSDSTTCLKAAATITTTVQVPFAITQALGYLYETAKEVYLTLTTGAATAAGTEILTGSIRYVVD